MQEAREGGRVQSYIVVATNLYVFFLFIRSCKGGLIGDYVAVLINIRFCDDFAVREKANP